MTRQFLIVAFARLLITAAAGLTIFTAAGMLILLFHGHVMHRPAVVAGLVGGPVLDSWIFPWLFREAKR